jgi:hypothetical protein
MRTLLIVCVLYAQSTFCQIKIRPLVEVGYGKNLMENFYSTNVLSASTGIKLNERFYFQINFIQSKDTQKSTMPNNPNDYYFNHVVSFSTSFRFLGNKHWISPSVTLDIGNEIASNARGKLIDGFNLYEDEHYHQPLEKYIRGKLFLKAKAQADFKYKDFNFLIGVGYTDFTYEAYKLKPISVNYEIIGFTIEEKKLSGYGGFSIDASLRYTLDFGKNKEK